MFDNLYRAVLVSALKWGVAINLICCIFEITSGVMDVSTSIIASAIALVAAVLFAPIVCLVATNPEVITIPSAAYKHRQMKEMDEEWPKM